MENQADKSMKHCTEARIVQGLQGLNSENNSSQRNRVCKCNRTSTCSGNNGHKLIRPQVNNV